MLSLQKYRLCVFCGFMAILLLYLMLRMPVVSEGSTNERTQENTQENTNRIREGSIERSTEENTERRMIAHSGIAEKKPMPKQPSSSDKKKQESAITDTKQISFIRDVAPILGEYCFACHDSKKRSGKYEMITFEKLMAGGSSGEAITPGKPEESDLWELMVTDAERRMPPRKDNLSPVPKEKAEIIKRWIAAGAKLDSEVSPKNDLVKELRMRWHPPAPPEKYDFPMPINALVFSPDNQFLIVGGYHELLVYRLDNQQLVCRVNTRAERTYAMLFLPNGFLAVAGGRPGQEGDVRLYDLQLSAIAKIGSTNKASSSDKATRLNGVDDPKTMRKQLLDSDDSILALALSPDGKKLAAAGCDRQIRLWNIQDPLKPQLEQSIENHADWVFSLLFSQDGKVLYSASRDKTAKAWDLASKESIATFPEHQNSVVGLAENIDKKSVFSAGGDNQIRQWKTGNDAKQIRSVGGHGDQILKLIPHAQLPIMASCSADKSVRLWDRSNGNQTKVLQGLTDFVFAIAFSPDGNLLAGADFNGDIKIWNVKSGTIVKSWNGSPGFSQPIPPKASPKEPIAKQKDQPGKSPSKKGPVIKKK